MIIEEKKSIETLIDNNIDAEQLYEYLTAPYGHKAGLYADGSFYIAETVGSEIDEDDRPVVWISCPGINNMDDPSWWTDEWTEYDEESGSYRIIEETRGHEIGDMISLDECIKICCNQGDVHDNVQELRENLKRELTIELEK
jgi:hypothetical protein